NRITAEDPVVWFACNPAYRLDCWAAMLKIAGASNDHSTSRLRCGLGDDINHTVDCIGAPTRSPRPANDFNSVDVLQRNVNSVPVDSGEGRGIDTPAVNHHQEFVTKVFIKSASADSPGTAIDLSYIDPGYHP